MASMQFIKNMGCSSFCIIRSMDTYGDDFLNYLQIESDRENIPIQAKIEVDWTDVIASLDDLESLKSSCSTFLVFGTYPVNSRVCEYATKFGMNTQEYVYIFISGSTSPVEEFKQNVKVLQNWFMMIPEQGVMYQEKDKEILDPNFYGLYLYDCVLVLSTAINNLINRGVELNLSVICEEINH